MMKYKIILKTDNGVAKTELDYYIQGFLANGQIESYEKTSSGNKTVFSFEGPYIYALKNADHISDILIPRIGKEINFNKWTETRNDSDIERSYKKDFRIKVNTIPKRSPDPYMKSYNERVKKKLNKGLSLKDDPL